MIMIEKVDVIHESNKGENNILKAMRQNLIVFNEKRIFTSISITSLTSSTERFLQQSELFSLSIWSQNQKV